jgi:hypothetical protein
LPAILVGLDGQDVAAKDPLVPSAATVASTVNMNNFHCLHPLGMWHDLLNSKRSGVRRGLIALSVELQLATVNRRLDHVITLLDSSSHRPQFTTDRPAEQAEINDEEKSPFKLLGTQVIMSILGLDANFAQRLRQLERTAIRSVGGASGRLYMVTHQQALT